MGLLHMLSYSPLLRALLFGLASGAWFTYFRLKQAKPKPFWLHLSALIGGFCGALGAVLLFGQLDAVGYAVDWSVLQEGWRRGLPMSLVIGLIEELAKLLPVLMLVWIRRRLDTPGDALFLASCAGIGFAAAEATLLFQTGGSPTEGLARAAAAPLTHALFAAPWGLGLGRWLMRGRTSALVSGFATSVLAHGLYNLLLAQPQLPPAAAASTVLALWVWLLLKLSPGMLRGRNAKQPVRNTGSFPAVIRP